MKARTKIQAEANEADRETYNLSLRLQRLAEMTGSDEIDELSRRLMGSRYHIRVHMHHDDITETA